MIEPKHTRSLTAASILMAAMLGTADSTGLAGWSPPGGWRPEISEELVPEPEGGKKRDAARQVILPYYSGSLSGLGESDLGGTGDLVTLYSPKLFRPRTNHIVITETTRARRNPTGLLKTYDFSQQPSVLKPSDKVVLSGGRPIEAVMDSLSSFGSPKGCGPIPAESTDYSRTRGTAYQRREDCERNSAARARKAG